MSSSHRSNSITFLAWAVLSGSSALAEVPTHAPEFTRPTEFTNDWFPFETGARKVYRGLSDDGRMVALDEYRDETRWFAWNGARVETCTLRELEFVSGELVESSDTYYAQADDGTVYYFGEVVDVYENGDVIGHDGSWLVGGPGVDDPSETAKVDHPFVAMPSNPEVGDEYVSEYLPPLLDETVVIQKFVDRFRVESGTYLNVMKTQEISGLRGGVPENKWYARGVGVVRSEGENQRLELISSTLLPPE